MYEQCPWLPLHPGATQMNGKPRCQLNTTPTYKRQCIHCGNVWQGGIISATGCKTIPPLMMAIRYTFSWATRVCFTALQIMDESTAPIAHHLTDMQPACNCWPTNPNITKTNRRWEITQINSKHLTSKLIVQRCTGRKWPPTITRIAIWLNTDVVKLWRD